MNTSGKSLAAFAAASIFAGATMAADQPQAKLPPEVMRGRYLVQIAGCNDCHTPGYAMSGGQVEESKWLTGDALGWQGPWGTTYPANLRLSVKNLSAGQFMALARGPLRPPMPGFALRDMKDADVKAIYAYLKYLGPAGNPAPAYLPPDQAPAGPFVKFPDPPQKPGT